MDINVQKYLDALDAGSIVITDHSVTPAAVAKDGVAAAVAPLFADAQAQLAAGSLIRTTVTVTTPELTTISLESGVVNLPMADAKKITNFVEAEEIVPVRLYLIVANKFLNASGLRIDEVAPVSDYLASPAKFEQDIVASVTEKLTHIDEEAAKPQVEEVPKTAAKTTTTRRRTTKTTAKKAPAKKTATKRTTKKTATKATARKTTTKKTATKK